MTIYAISNHIVMEQGTKRIELQWQSDGQAVTPSIIQSIDPYVCYLHLASHLWPQWTCMIFNAYHRKREDNLFENVRFLIWNFFKVLRYTCRMHYCWPKKCYIYYPHYSNYFLIVHAVFNADKITFRKMMFLDYANFLIRQMLQNREW